MTLQVTKAVVSNLWEDLILAFIGGQLPHHDMVTGVVAHIRSTSVNLQLWYQDPQGNATAVEQLRDGVVKALQLPDGAEISVVSH